VRFLANGNRNRWRTKQPVCFYIPTFPFEYGVAGGS
jgi:hypothetical protein